jgi:16S rRNA (guanine966-N2)-methyltransferase
VARKTKNRTCGNRDHCGNSLRIIGGRLKGRRLAGVRGQIRPTADRVREAIFNILGADVEDCQVLDLFAGTGALGIEALSRGARNAVFVENHKSALHVLQRNLSKCGVTEASRILPLPAGKALPRLAAAGEHFSLIFLDPPYGYGIPEAMLVLLAQKNLVAPNGQIIVEHSRGEELAADYQHLVRQDQRRYGTTLISFYLCGNSGHPGGPEV